MPVIFCNVDPFTVYQYVLEVSPSSNREIYKGNFEQVADFMANAYSTGQYEKIILKGNIYASFLEEKIRKYGKTTYELDDVKIEVIK